MQRDWYYEITVVPYIAGSQLLAQHSSEMFRGTDSSLVFDEIWDFPVFAFSLVKEEGSGAGIDFSLFGSRIKVFLYNFVETVAHRVDRHIPEIRQRHIHPAVQADMSFIQQKLPSADYAYGRKQYIPGRSKHFSYSFNHSGKKVILFEQGHKKKKNRT